MKGKSNALISKKIESLRAEARNEWQAHIDRTQTLARYAVRTMHESQRKWRRDEAEARANFLYQHADQLGGLALFDQRAALHLALSGMPPGEWPPIDWPPAGLPPRDAILEGRWWTEFQKDLSKAVADIYLHPSINWYGMTLIEVGSFYTVLGRWLGAVPGTVTLIDCNGNSHMLTIMSWSDLGILFGVPATLGGIPFECAGQLEIKLADGTIFTRPVTIEPISYVMFSIDSFSDHGWGITSYGEPHIFRSATLPASYRQFDFTRLYPILYSGCVLFKTADVLWSEIDGPVQVASVSAPYLNGGVLEVQANLTDDLYWNFTVTAEFYIVVPQGIPAPGWHT